MTYKVYFEQKNGIASETTIRGEKRLEQRLAEMVESGMFRLIGYERKDKNGTVEHIEVLNEGSR